ncbi:unnamed protein product [Mytilus edulis]|uniref:Uncharacterized protein n=1 Tax=Mytilus edulis TaxID=6550 RepID=A0A8S3QMI9_MYTED|nr:unnamed protein product [Mytilus edulis]
MKRCENHENPCRLMTTASAHINENNLKVDSLSLMSGDSTSSYDEYQQDSTQDYLNPYQSMIQSEMLPREASEYPTLAPDYSRIDSDMPYHKKKVKRKIEINLKVSGAEWNVIGKVTEYGQNMGLYSYGRDKTTMPHVLDALTYGESTSTSVQDIGGLLSYNKTTIPQVVDASTNGESTDNIVQDATTPSRNLGTTSNVEDIINSAKGKKASIIPSQNPAIPQNGQNIEMENRLYDIINETDMLDDQQVQQMEMSPSYLDDSTQDYLNPYQSMIQSEMSPPEISEYLTLAQDNSGDSTSPTDEFIRIQHMITGEVKDVCCADTEANGNGCIACSKGYTSTIGQSCRPCPKNSFGERCANDCNCPVFHSELNLILSDEATSPQVLDASTNGESSNIFQGLLSREIIVYLTLSVLVLIFGICLCFIFYKYKTVNKKKKATITQSQNPSPTPNSHNIEMEERLYDVIDDADLIEDQQLKDIQMSPDYLDVISGSNSTGSGEGKTVENHENNFESLSTDQIKMLVNKVICSSLNNRESTSSSGEDRPETKQDYLNPYQSVIKTSPPNIREYLTLATVHNRTDNSVVENKSDVFSTDKKILKDPKDLQEIGLRRPYEYENSSISVEYAVPQHCLSRNRGRETKSCENLNNIRLKTKMSYRKVNENETSNKDDSLDYYNLTKTRSESDIFCQHSLKE